MPDASDTLLKILESVMRSHTQIVDALTRLEERQQEHNLVLARAVGENTRLLAKGIEDNSQALARLIEGTSQSLAQILDRMEARMAADNRALADILKYVAETVTRSEQMTARILTEISGRGASH